MESLLHVAASVLVVVLFALWQSRRRARRRPDTPWHQGSLVLGEFLVEQEIGSGGMGVVYLVRSHSSGRQFAVKRSIVHDIQRRRALLEEIRTWIGLPEHPHLVTCHFFSTVGNEVVIFAEFIEGGSLGSWIAERRLTSVGAILDVAIQVAWGLEAIHEKGLVHQDVKPSNILLSPDRVAKVTDFGIARGLSPAGGSALMSRGAMTPAYCSPEQAEGRPIGRQTDIWSFGLAVLEMFMGEVTWLSGVAAPEVLDSYAGPTDPALPVMAEPVGEILRRCFRLDPSERWVDFGDVARALADAYEHITGSKHPREKPEVVARPAAPYDRRPPFRAGWEDPGPWLAEVLRETGRDPADAERFLRPPGATAKERLLIDLEAYEEVIDVLSAMASGGRSGLLEHISALLMNKALVHAQAGDAAGAVRAYDRAIAFIEPLARDGRRSDLRDRLAAAHASKGVTLLEQGHVDTAVTAMRRAIDIRRELHRDAPSEGASAALARTCTNLSAAVEARGDHRDSSALLDEAIALYERLERPGSNELRGELASAYVSKAAVLCELGKTEEALALFDAAIALLRRLIEGGRKDLAHELARARTNKALALSEQGRALEALAIHDEVIAERARLVAAGAGADAAALLAAAYTNKANAAMRAGDAAIALRAADEAVTLYQRLFEEEGHLGLRGDLARARLLRAWALDAMGERTQARAEAERGMSMLDEQIERGGLVDDRRWMIWARRRFPGARTSDV